MYKFMKHEKLGTFICATRLLVSFLLQICVFRCACNITFVCMFTKAVHKKYYPEVLGIGAF